MPEVGISDRWGVNWDQPLFWAINDSSDATLYAQLHAGKGRSRSVWNTATPLTNQSYGAIMADGLEDRKVDDGTTENTRKVGLQRR
jgi:LPS-assembly protein